MEVKIRNVSKRYGDDLVLNDIDFDVKDGEFVSIVGPSGCGKTTLLRIIEGLTKPSSGNIEYGDRSTKSDIGFVFQDYALFEWRTVIGNLKTAQKLSGQDVSSKKALNMLERVGLQHCPEKYPKELSGGMKQRLALARTLIHEPDLVLMDEPFAALDELTKENLYEEFETLLGYTDRTIIYVTHNIDEAFLFSDRIVVINSEGGVAEILDLDSNSPRDKQKLEEEGFFELKSNIIELIGQ